MEKAPWSIVFLKKSLILLPEFQENLFQSPCFIFIYDFVLIWKIFLHPFIFLKSQFSFYNMFFLKKLNPYMIILSYVMVCHSFFYVMFMM